MRSMLIAALVVFALGGGAAWYVHHRADGSPRFRLALVARGNLRVTVTATGTVQPFLQVQVGTQVTGTIQKLFVDFNSRVEKNQKIAQIDPAPYQSAVEQDRANLIRSQADVGRVQAGLIQAEKDLLRSRELAKRDLISVSDLDAAVAAYDSLVAQLKVAGATVDQSRATLNISEVNLGYTNILSPIDGIVISRNADMGQTLAASLSAPTIFVIADEMKKIQVQASVAEADIGRISGDQRVSFAVDAYRDTVFKGIVTQVRLLPTTVQNVVTYTVLIDADNPERKLLPGMTATISFEVSELNDVLRIPNAALRFSPATENEPPASKSSGPGTGHGRIWIPGPSGPSALSVTVGATDGMFTQMVKGDLHEGEEVIIGVLQEETASR
jgi:HlyD family secretion protein